jgi:tryptophan synthase beta chain
MTVAVPGSWYNIHADLPFEVPRDLPPPGAADGGPSGTGGGSQVPKQLIRQATSRSARVEIPQVVAEAYDVWRPTPLRRAVRLERALGTTARVYYKYEGSNVSGSHKLNTAIAQAYAYQQAGVRRLTTGTGAGQWGTAMAVAGRMFGLDSTAYMVALSYEQKPYRRTIMEMFGATVAASPSEDTEVGRAFRATDPSGRGNIALAIAEAMEDAAAHPDTRFCIGSGEDYSILHQTVIGLEAREQLAEHSEAPDVVVASVGAGSNFGGMAFPFLRDRLRSGRAVRCVAVEPASCPKLTRGTYAYDFTDYSGTTPLEKMYTLGSRFVAPAMHAGGLRYHATSKLVSAIRHHGLIEAVAYPQTEVFASGRLFCETEGILPAPESAHAIHGAIVEAQRATAAGTSPCIVVCVSGHGYFDMAAYADALSGRMIDPEIGDEQFALGLAALPEVPVPATAAVTP